MKVFDAFATHYDNWYSTPLGVFVDEVERKMAMELAPFKYGMKVLDVGCGTGNYTSYIAKMGCKVIGLDISEKMLNIARQKLPETCFVQSSIYGMPFKKNTFDIVFSMATFEFIHEFEAAYFEMKRIVKPGGHILIGTINGDSAWGEYFKSKAGNKNSVFHHTTFKTPSVLKSIDSSNLVRFGYCLFFPPIVDESMLSWEYEEKCSKSERPGFIAGLWQKEN